MITPVERQSVGERGNQSYNLPFLENLKGSEKLLWSAENGWREIPAENDDPVKADFGREVGLMVHIKISTKFPWDL